MVDSIIHHRYQLPHFKVYFYWYLFGCCCTHGLMHHKEELVLELTYVLVYIIKCLYILCDYLFWWKGMGYLWDILSLAWDTLIIFIIIRVSCDFIIVYWVTLNNRIWLYCFERFISSPLVCICFLFTSSSDNSQPYVQCVYGKGFWEGVKSGVITIFVLMKY